MKNIVLFDIDHTEPIIIKHNGLEVEGSVVNCIKGTNVFTIEGANYTVNDITMYGMGKGEIIKHFTNEQGIWTLKYDYPVFSWLHKILQHGWLLKEDDE